MDQFSKDFGGLHSPDDFDLLSLGLVPGQEEQAETADQDEPRINPLHDSSNLQPDNLYSDPSLPRPTTSNHSI